MTTVRAELEGTTSRVVAPRAVIDAWAGSDQVGFEAEVKRGLTD